MNKEEIKVLYKFFDAKEKTRVLGGSDYSAIIYLVNENEKIVNDLDKNAINFLDYVICRYKINENNCYDAIVKELQVLNKLDKKYDRKEITLTMFLEEFDKEEL